MLKRINETLTQENQGRLRFVLARAESRLHRLRFVNLETPKNGWPILFGISFPKSGTNLLAQILEGFSRVAPFSPHILQHLGLGVGMDAHQRKALVERQLAGLRPLDVATAHLPARKENLAIIRSPRFLPFLILRDPRDVAVSLVYYVTEMEKKHHLHDYYASTLKSFDERLLASIQGVELPKFKSHNIGRQIEVYLDWLAHPDVHFVRFEDLIENRPSALNAITDHFLRRVETLSTRREKIVEALELSINPSRSSTFRLGKTGEWKNHFTETHKRIFKEVAGDLLVKLGYEKDSDW